MIMKNICMAGAVAASLLVALPASATVVLTFEGVGNAARVDDFYNGGTDSAGHSGTDYGIHFSSNSLGVINSNAGGTGATRNDPSGVTSLYFLSGAAATMDVAAGFSTGFSFYYTSNEAASINVYSGLDATGTLLATLALPAVPGAYSVWDPIGVTFSGIAHSVDFGGTENHVAFDNITLGAAAPGSGAVPEPATWAMMLLGLGMAGYAMRKRPQVRSRKVTFANA